ncbi:MAG: DNA mismatch repair protein MutS [Bacillota bacterium]
MRMPRLLHPECSEDPRFDPPEHLLGVERDLELDLVLDAMADGDFTVREVSRSLLLGFETKREPAIYRQRVLRDCLRNPELIRDLYSLAERGARLSRRHPLGLLRMSTASSILSGSATLMSRLLEVMERMRETADGASSVESGGLRDVVTVLKERFDGERIREMRDLTERLARQSGALISVNLGLGSRDSEYVLRERRRRRRGVWESLLRRIRGHLFGPRGSVHHFRVDARDQASNEALVYFQRRAMSPVANTLARASEHLLAFLDTLRVQLAFYVGCINLAESLERAGYEVSFPDVRRREDAILDAKSLYDPALVLTTASPVVANDLRADGRDLILITGANQGGKTTFLRSVGLAQLMMQAGMFVTASCFSSSLRPRLFTHFRREEDVSMRRGKLDEELARVDAMLDRLRPDSMVLLNESFAATNEREGSAIAGEVLEGLRQANITVLFVTHLLHLAHRLHRAGDDGVLFLRAVPREGGTRSFEISEGPPQSGGFAEDIYADLFGRELPGIDEE